MLIYSANFHGELLSNVHHDFPWPSDIEIKKENSGHYSPWLVIYGVYFPQHIVATSYYHRSLELGQILYTVFFFIQFLTVLVTKKVSFAFRKKPRVEPSHFSKLPNQHEISSAKTVHDKRIIDWMRPRASINYFLFTISVKRNQHVTHLPNHIKWSKGTTFNFCNVYHYGKKNITTLYNNRKIRFCVNSQARISLDTVSQKIIHDSTMSLFSMQHQ